MKMRLLLKKGFLGCAGLVGVVVVLFFAVIIAIVVWQSIVTASLSRDQKAVIEQLGKPDTYVISTNKAFRYEVWNYYSHETAFEFMNGKLAGDKRIPRLSDEFAFPDFDSTDFKHNTTLDSIFIIMGGAPTAEGSTTMPGLEDVTIYDYFDQVKFGLRDDKLVFVQTLPVPVAK